MGIEVRDENRNSAVRLGLWPSRRHHFLAADGLRGGQCCRRLPALWCRLQHPLHALANVDEEGKKFAEDGRFGVILDEDYSNDILYIHFTNAEQKAFGPTALFSTVN